MKLFLEQHSGGATWSRRALSVLVVNFIQTHPRYKLHDQKLGSLANASAGTLRKSFFAGGDLSPTLEGSNGHGSNPRQVVGTSPRNWADFQEAFFTPIYDAILDRIGITAGSAGMRVLDVGCGAGLFCALAAKRGAIVSGLDAAEALLDVARKRTPSGDFRQGEMEELPFADGTFDVVTGFNSLHYAADPVNALRQARRVSKPSAKVAMAVWGWARLSVRSSGQSHGYFAAAAASA